MLERNDKYYTLDIRGRRDTVSIDRLKPAFVDDDFDIATGPTIAVRCQREQKNLHQYQCVHVQVDKFDHRIDCK